MHKLLIFHQGALGDLVTLFPVLIRLRSQFRTIGIICKNQIGQLARYLNLVDSVYPAEAAVFSSLFSDGPIPDQLSLISEYDTILLFSYSTILKQRVCSLTKASVHLIPPRPETGRRMHITDHYACQLEGLSVLKRQRGEGLQGRMVHSHRRSPAFDPKYLLLHPGSGSRRKNWPIDRYLAVAQQLSVRGFHVNFLLGPAEEHLAIDRLTPVERPPDLIALVKTLEMSDGYIGNDSGASHLAAFLGLPTVAVFGPSDPRRWAPRGLATAIVRSEQSCEPCFETNVSPCPSMDCLEGISPATVVAALVNLLSR